MLAGLVLGWICLAQNVLNSDFAEGRRVLASNNMLKVTIVEILQHSPAEVFAVAKINSVNASILVKIPLSDVGPRDTATLTYSLGEALDPELTGYYKVKRIVARVEKVSLISFEKSPSIVRSLYQVKLGLSTFLVSELNYANGALLAGLMWGDTSLLPRSIKNNFTQVGLNHVMAISGANMTLLAQIITLVFGFLPVRWRYCLVIILTLFFGALVGMSAAVLRSVLMAITSGVASVSGQKYRSSRAFIFVLIGVFIFNPLIVLYDASFQLSCAATASLLYLSPVIKLRMSFITIKFIHELISTTIAITIGTLPIIFYYFSVWYPMSLLVNILLLPIISVLSLLIYCSFLFLLVPFVQTMVGVVINFLFTTLLEVIHQLATISSTVVVRWDIPLSVVFLWYFIIAYFLIERSYSGIISRVKSFVGKR